MADEAEGTEEVRTRSYRVGTTLSGGTSIAHYYMSIKPGDAVHIQGTTPEEGQTRKKRTPRLAIFGRLEKGEDDEAALFPTEVDDSVLVEARGRLQAKFGLVKWEPKAVVTEKMRDIINPKVAEYINDAETSLTTNRPEVCLRLLIRINHLDRERCAGLESQMRFVALTELCDFQAAHAMASRNAFPPERLAWCFFAYGQTLMDIGLFNQALRAFIEAAKLEPDRIEHKLKQIEALYRMKRYVECVGVVTDLLRENRREKTRSADLFTLRARLHDVLSNVREVLNDIQRALRVDPGHVSALSFLQDFRQKAQDLCNEAMVFYAKGRFREAADRLTTCMQTDPNNPDFYYKRALVNRRLLNYREAIDDLLESMAKIELLQGSTSVTSETLRDARRQLVLLLNDMAVDCYNRQMFEDAIRLLDRAVRFEKQEIAFYVNRGDAFYAIDEMEMALNDYEQAREISPDSSAVTTRIVLIHSHRGLLAMRERNFEDAEVALTEAIKIRPHDYDLRILRARCRVMMDRDSDAAYDMTAALILNTPLNDPHLSTLMPRLFPGQTPEEILASEIARLVHAEIGGDNERIEAFIKASTMLSSYLSHDTTSTMAFSIKDAELLNERRFIRDEMHVLASGPNREAWIALAARLAPRTTKWRGGGADAGPLDRPLLRPAVARLTSDGQVTLVSNKQKSYAFRWKTADTDKKKAKRKSLTLPSSKITH